MLARINKAMAKKDSGFTLIELLVVVIIIGILAAIAIPTFLNQRQNGYRAQLVSDLRNAATAAESYAVDNNGGYVPAAPNTTTLDAFLKAPANLRPSAGVTINSATGSATTFCVQATHAQLPTGSQVFSFNKANGEPRAGACTAP